MHVLMANGSLSGGGAERMLALLAGDLRARGHEVSVAALSAGGEVLDRLRHEGFPILSDIGGAASLPAAILSARQRAGRLAARRIDLVHTHDLRSLIEIGASRRAGGTFTHVHTFHFGHYPHVPRRHLLLERLFAGCADRLVAVGYRQRGSLVAAHGWKASSVDVLPNGVDATPGDAGVAARRGPVRIGSLSAYIPQKGLDVLLGAARRMKDMGQVFELSIVGDGPLRPELEALAARLDLRDVVQLPGWAPDAADRILPTLDVFVQSSLWEAMSMVVLEAMAAARAIVATTVGDNDLMLDGGRAGLLVPPRDPDALATALTRLVEDATLRHTLGAAALGRQREMYTTQAMGARYEQLYRDAVGRAA